MICKPRQDTADIGEVCRQIGGSVEVCFERGLTAKQVSIETIRLALKRLGVGWQRAKYWITSVRSVGG